MRDRQDTTHNADLIRAENERPGTRDWMLIKTAIDPVTKYRCPWIEGYCSRASVQAGETLEIMVSTNPPSLFSIDVYRMGYYAGAGGRHMGQWGAFAGSVQPDPPIGRQRVRECRWVPSMRLKIPDDWLSGVYLGKLTAEKGGWQSYIVFVVRDRWPADFLFQCATNTWQAYNRWPNQFSLYDDGYREWYCGPNVRVSYDRPYGKYCQVVDAPLSTGSGEFLLWEYPVAFWMEQEGYDVTYATNVDTHADPDALLCAKSFLSVGHDEYWSVEMYDNVKRAIASGVNAAFLCGNSVDGLTPLEPGATGVPDRTLSRVGLFGAKDEAYHRNWQEKDRLTVIGPSDALLMGAGSVGPVTGGGDWICADADHWLFAGTGMKQGDGIPGLVGWEYHGGPADLPGLQIVATGTTRNGSNQEDRYTAVIFPGPKDNLVFNAATIWWGDGLSEPPGYVRPAVYARPQGPDPRVQRITRNLFQRFLASSERL